MSHYARGYQKKIRYAVLGLGHIAQVAILPAFKNARSNSELKALVSDDPDKLRQLGRKYRVPGLYRYDEYDALLASGEIDAVYISLPNHLHADYSIRAANHGVHVLCEKPMAVTSFECRKMIDAASQNGVRLMIAYRLHFEPANLEAIRCIKRERIGEPRVFTSTFTMPVREGNIRTEAAKGGGPVYDIGIYCINAARYLFREEPIEVVAAEACPGRPPFEEVEEAMSVILRFSDEKIASFVCSFGAFDHASYIVAGTKGSVALENAYGYGDVKKLRVCTKSKENAPRFKATDQFAPEIEYFSDCVLKNREPEPSGYEGLADVRIIEEIYHSAHRSTRVKLVVESPGRRPEPISARDISNRKPEPRPKSPLVHVEAPSKDEAA